MIKNWTVKTKQIKKRSRGLINHFNYLFDKNRSAHFYSEIVDLNNSSQKLENILNQVEERQIDRKSKGLRGGGVSNFATSFVVSLPRDIQQPSHKEWSNIATLTLTQLANDLNLDKKTLFDNSVVVLHDESNSLEKSSHLHILVSNVLDCEVVKPISQYAGTYAVKKGINKAVKQVLNVDHKKYVPQKENVQDVPLYVAREQKKQEFEIFIENKKQEIKEDYENKKEDLKNDSLKNKVKEKALNAKEKSIDEKFERFKKAINFGKKIFSDWVRAVRSNQDKKTTELKAKDTAKVIAEIETNLPAISEALLENAKREEELRSLTEELDAREKVTEHYPKEKAKVEEKAKNKRKRRTRKP